MQLRQGNRVTAIEGLAHPLELVRSKPDLAPVTLEGGFIPIA